MQSCSSEVYDQSERTLAYRQWLDEAHERIETMEDPQEADRLFKILMRAGDAPVRSDAHLHSLRVALDSVPG